MQRTRNVCEWEIRKGYWTSGCNGGDMERDWPGPKAYAWEFCPWCGGDIDEVDNTEGAE